MSSVGALLLAPGAGADRNHHTLVAVEQAVTPVPVARMDFPSRKAGKKAPDRAPVAIAAVVEEATEMVARSRIRANRLALGGRSFGGRMCSLAVADGLPAAGLVLLSYPLHPPGKPEKLRVDHFESITVPCLFIGGVKDPFGTPEEFAEHTSRIIGAVTHVWLPGGHDPRNCDELIALEVQNWLKSLR